MNQASEIYSGYLYITRKQILGGTKLVKKWCVLKKYGTSNKLEYHESKEHLTSKPNSTDLDKITNIEKIDHGFKILFEKQDKLIFECEEECVFGWIQALNSLLPISKDTMNRASVSSLLGDDVIIDEVILYESFCDAPIFYVEVEPNEDSRKCHLSKGIKYKLVTNKHNLALRDLQDNILWQCPYMYVRRYVRANGIFQIEAGRRCPTGVGTFLLLTEEGDKIFECINDRTQTKRIQDNKDYLHPPPKQTAPPTKKQTPPPTRTQAPPPMKTQAPPPMKTQAPPPTKTQAPPPLKTQAPPSPLKTQAPPPPLKTPTEHKDTPENFTKTTARSTSNDTSQKHHDASGDLISSQSHDRTFKQTLDKKLSNPLSSPEPEKLLLKGPLTNPHIGEAHAKKLSPPLSKKDKEKMLEKKKKEEKERKKEEKERKKEEKKEKKEKKKNQKDKPVCPPPTPTNNEPLLQYEEVDRMTNQELAESGNFYESMPNEAVPVVRIAHSSGVYSEADANIKKAVISPKPGEATARGQKESKVNSPSKNTYSEPQKVAAAWRDQSEKPEDHFEDYENIKLAAKEKKDMDILQGHPLPDDEEDETYDSINAPRKQEQTESENIYGFASCKALEDLDNQTDNGYEVTHINVEVISLSGDKGKQSDKILTLQNTYTPSESSDFDTYDQIK